MGDKPSHKIVPLGGPDCEPAEIHYCEDCKIHFAVDPCTEENTVNTGHSLESCCPKDPAHGDEDREYWTMNDDCTSQTLFMELKPGPIDLFEYQKEKVLWFRGEKESCHHSHDCCGCWFQTTKVKESTKDGWMVFSKSFSKNI